MCLRQVSPVQFISLVQEHTKHAKAWEAVLTHLVRLIRGYISKNPFEAYKFLSRNKDAFFYIKRVYGNLRDLRDLMNDHPHIFLFYAIR